jgi:hypothetical protein
MTRPRREPTVVDKETATQLIKSIDNALVHIRMVRLALARALPDLPVRNEPPDVILEKKAGAHDR